MQFNITLIEDCAESLGSFIGDSHTGLFGRLAAISFNGNKIITTGGGGMIITNDDELAARAKHITTTAKCSHPYEYYHDELVSITGYSSKCRFGTGSSRQVE